MRKQFYEYMYLTRQERNGLFVVIFMSSLISFTPLVYSFFGKKRITDFSQFLNEIEEFQQADISTPPLTFTKNNFANTTPKKQFDLFFFDPNSASKEDFINLGISPKTTQTIINFRNKGAKFFKKEDFKKVYGLKKSDFNRLEKFIQIKKKKNNFQPFAKNEIPKSYDTPTVNHIAFDPNTADVNILLQNGIPQHVANTIIKYRSSGAIFQVKEDLKKIYTLKDDIYQKIEPFIQIIPQEKKAIAKEFKPKNDFLKTATKPTNIVIDINKSSPEDWQQLRGIGPSFSRRIIKFRDRLGGFHSIEQVGETYGLPDSSFQKIKSQLQLSSILQKINLNQATENELKLHPYISWNQAKLICSYRKMHGNFKDVNELLQIGALKEDWLEKIKYYLKI
ncbi:MAG: helix-hairpin-helix domain-containing protein [Saprospiraceae bacterium]